MGRLIDLFYNKYNYTDFHELNLSWLLDAVKQLLIAMDNMEEWKTQHIEEYEELKKLYDDLMAGNYPDTFIDSLTKWIDKYGVDIIAAKIKAVHFGLTNDGYFCAYIPESWSDIHFDTVTDYNDALYGHLMLLYD